MNYLKAMSQINNWKSVKTTKVETTAILLLKQIADKMYELEYTPALYHIWSSIQELAIVLDEINKSYKKFE